MQTTALAKPTNAPCAKWCSNHEPAADICFTDDIIIKVPDPDVWQVREVAVGLAAETTGGTVATLAVNGTGFGELSLDDAEAIGLAFLAIAAAGRRGGAR